MAWVSVDERLPDLGDYSVLVHFGETGSIESVHVQDYFSDITAGESLSGEQQYTKWYKSQNVTHWHLLPDAPTLTA